MKITIHKAVKAVIKRDNSYLVLKARFGPQKILYYDLPGGRVQNGEDPIVALSREITEETGLTEITIGKNLGLWWFERMDKSIVECSTYLCFEKNSKINLDINPDEDEDIVGYIWMTKEELLQQELFENDSIFEIFKKLD